jgi:hypothetical protein
MTGINEPQRVAPGKVSKPANVENQAVVAPANPTVAPAPPNGSPAAPRSAAFPAQRVAPTNLALPAWSPKPPAAGKDQAASPVPPYSDTFGNHSYVKDGSNPAMLALMSRAVASHPELASGPLGQDVNKGHVGPQQVQALQQFLQSKGYSVGSKGVDGKFGPDTHAALASLLNGQSPTSAAPQAPVPPNGATHGTPGDVKPTVNAPDAPPKASPAPTGANQHTAVYDVSTHTVYLPDGTKLEAHSGIGAAQDNPNSGSQRNRGSTPTGVYKLTPREARYHGVAALRLTPVNGTDTHGRDGLLTHSYMFGPRGESHGCVVFRNYPAFLQAYQSGQVNQIKVVPHL